MGERCSKVGSINIGLPGGFGEEETMATRTEHINGIIPGQIRESHWQNGLPLAKHSRTASKRSRPVLFIHGMHTTICQNVAVFREKNDG